ncbi:MAG: hypothetical protein WBE21_00840 [Candidatus Acidiferrales bacterium]|jgi:hypothetical protein|nr:hypothetical protein [Candidatus Acidoferrales bacterium]
MRTLSFFFAALLFSTGALAQQSQNSSTMQMQCRTLTSGQTNFLQPNEIMIDGKACHTAAASPSGNTAQTATAQTTQPSAAQPTPATSSNAVAPAPMPATSTSIVPGSTVYIAPMNGFENYLAAAIEKKKVPLVAVANESQATYVIKGTSEEKKAGWAKMAFTGQIHSDDAASVQMINRQTGAIVFAYAVNKKNTWHGQQTTAEACAKHLKDQIEKK